VTKRHDSACGLRRAAAGTVASGFQARAEPLRVDEVGERLLAVDLDNGKQFSVATFELQASGDVDHLEIEVDLAADLSDDLERPFAEAAGYSVVDGDASRYGYSPRVVVASATR
jgi:hypothetical protein